MGLALNTNCLLTLSYSARRRLSVVGGLYETRRLQPEGAVTVSYTAVVSDTDDVTAKARAAYSEAKWNDLSQARGGAWSAAGAV